MSLVTSKLIKIIYQLKINNRPKQQKVPSVPSVQSIIINFQQIKISNLLKFGRDLMYNSEMIPYRGLNMFKNGREEGETRQSSTEWRKKSETAPINQKLTKF